MDLEDDAKFQCQIGAADGIKPIRSQYATLTVLVPPDPPKLMPTGDLLKTVEGRQVELRCESRGGKPASEVSLCTVKPCNSGLKNSGKPLYSGKF